jgi:iron-sulfur cluster repair protein YtfE (RIC family)
MMPDERTVSDYLESDHVRLDRMLKNVERLLVAEDFAGSATVFDEFSRGLNRHIEAEEQVLFPEFERRTGITGGPTVVMRAEHVEIRNWMTVVAARLDERDGLSARKAISHLTATLSDHNMKEEHVVYPMTDAAADESEREAIVRQMEALTSPFTNAK